MLKLQAYSTCCNSDDISTTVLKNTTLTAKNDALHTLVYELSHFKHSHLMSVTYHTIFVY